MATDTSVKATFRTVMLGAVHGDGYAPSRGGLVLGASSVSNVVLRASTDECPRYRILSMTEGTLLR